MALLASTIDPMGGFTSAPNTELIAAFREYQQLRGRAETTITRETGIVRALARDTGQPLLAVTTDDVKAWLLARRRSDRTRYTYTSYLASFFGWACRTKLLAENPIDGVPRPTLPRLLPRPIPDADIEVAFAHADCRMTLWLCLDVYQGLRVSEMSRLRIEDFLTGLTPPMLRVFGKGRKERVIPLNPNTEVAFAAYVTTARPSGFLFRDPERVNPLRPGTIGQYIARHLRGLGINATAHQGRHSFGTNVYRLSKDLRLTQEMLGHSNPQSSAGYAAYSPTDAVEIVCQLGSPSSLEVGCPD